MSKQRLDDICTDIETLRLAGLDDDETGQRSGWARVELTTESEWSCLTGSTAADLTASATYSSASRIASTRLQLMTVEVWWAHATSRWGRGAHDAEQSEAVAWPYARGSFACMGCDEWHEEPLCAVVVTEAQS